MTTISHKASSFSFSLVAHKDNDLAQIYLDDFISELGDRLMTFSDRGVDYMVILPEGVLSYDCAYKVAKLNRMKKADLFAEVEKFENCYYIEDLTRAEMIDILLFKDYEDYYQAEFNEKRFGDRDSDFTVYGYCQGDAIEVKLVGKCEEWITSDYLKNLYFNSPHYVVFTVTDEQGTVLNEINLCEYKNEYEDFDKDETIRIFSTTLEYFEGKAEVVKWLNNNIPEVLDY